MDKYSDFVDYIKGLPISSSPEAFGLHDNANISRENQETAEVIKAVANLSYFKRSFKFLCYIVVVEWFAANSATKGFRKRSRRRWEVSSGHGARAG